MSLLLGYFTTSFAIELLVFLFLQIARILKTKNNPKSTIQVIVSGDTTIMIHSTKPASDESASSTKDQIQWLEKKYEFLFEDYKDSQKIYFSFAYYLTAFNVIYILLIFSLQTVPVLQCFSITLLALILILFPAIIKPFQKKIPAFLHFFNFSCIFLAAFLNLVLAIAQNLNYDFSGLKQQGKAVISIIATNTIINTIISLGVLIFEIYQKCKSVRNSGRSKKENKQNLKVLKIEISSSANKENSPADLSNTTLKPRPRDSRSRRGNVQLTCSEASFSIER